MPILGIDYEICSNCTICLTTCFYFRRDKEKNKVVYNDPMNFCNLCGHCIGRCPEDAIKQESLIEEYTRDNDTFYRITENGKDEFFKRLENTLRLNKIINKLVSFFDGLLGGDAVKEREEEKDKPVSDYTLCYRDYVFGLLSIDWRIDEMFEEGTKAGELIPDDKMSFGTIIEYLYKNSNF